MSHCDVCRCVLLFFVSCTASVECLGQNPDFIPGDAFFHSMLSEKFCNSLDEGAIEFEYAQPPGGDFGGFTGLSRLVVGNVPKSKAAALQDIYRRLREKRSREFYEVTSKEGKKSLVEANPFHLFIYNRDAKWETQRLGLKLNESWNNLPDSAFKNADLRAKLGFQGSRIPVYSSFIQSYEAVAYDLKAGPQFDRLAVRVPEVPWGISGEKIVSPVMCDYESIQIVVVADQQLERYFKKKENTEFYVLSNDVTVNYWENGRLVSNKVEKDETKESATVLK